MQEVVRKFDELSGRRQVRVAFQKARIISGFIVLVIGTISLGVTALGFWYLRSENNGAIDQELYEGFVWLAVYSLFTAGAGITILVNKSKTGPILALLSGGLLSFGYWYFGIPAVLAGVVAFRTRHRIDEAIVSIVQRDGVSKLATIAQELKTTEAEVEIALRSTDLSEKLKFNIEERSVSSV